MLAEGIVRQQQAVLGDVGEHAIRPVQHGRLQEGERPVSQRDRVPGANDLSLPAVLEVLAEGIGATLAMDQRRLGRPGHHGRNGTRMVQLSMVGDDEVDPRGIHHLSDVVEEYILKPRRDRIDQGGILVHHEVGVVRGAPLDVIGVPVKMAHLPVHCPNPVHVLSYLDSHSL